MFTDVLHKTLNLVISRCCFAEDGIEMCSAVLLFCIVLWRSRCHRRRRCLSSLSFFYSANDWRFKNVFQHLKIPYHVGYGECCSKHKQSVDILDEPQLAIGQDHKVDKQVGQMGFQTCQAGKESLSKCRGWFNWLFNFKSFFVKIDAFLFFLQKDNKHWWFKRIMIFLKALSSPCSK